MAKMTILITGSTGFVGVNLLKYLNANHSFNLLTLDREKLADISTEDLNNVYCVIHLAGKAHDLKKTLDDSSYYDINYGLTIRLYDHFLISNASKFVFISSVKAAADSVSGTLFEDVIPNPQTAYGKSKLMAEQYLTSRELPNNKQLYILRPCMIHGPGNKGNLNLLYQVVKKGIPYPLASFNNNRSFLSIENLCFIISELTLRPDLPSGIYNVADDETLSTNDVVNILSHSLKSKARLWYISPKILNCIARISDVLHLPLTTERLSKLTESYVVSNAKLKRVINKPMPISVRKGLEITAKSFHNS